MASSAEPDTFVLPDLLSLPFASTVNKYEDVCSPQTDRWLENGAPLTVKQRDSLHGLASGLLAARMFPDCDYDALRIGADFINYLFHLDDLIDDLDKHDADAVRDAVTGVMLAPQSWKAKIDMGEAHPASAMIYDLWSRITARAGPLVQKRFLVNFDAFLRSVAQQAVFRKRKIILDIRTYLVARRDNGATRPCCALAELAADIELPETVWGHPIMRRLEDAAVDLIDLANDVYSYNVEQARGDTHNIIAVVMHEKGLELQDAIDYVDRMFKDIVQEYLRLRGNMPTWGDNIDKDVQAYIRTIDSFIIGASVWSFETTRYFGTEGRTIMKLGIVKLLPKM